MSKRRIINHLNELSHKDWLKFQKSWFVHNPPPRRKDVLRHPAKFPEAVERATGVQPPQPAVLAGIEELPTRCSVLDNDLATVRSFIEERVG